jgi:hypothetical protein
MKSLDEFLLVTVFAPHGTRYIMYACIPKINQI